VSLLETALSARRHRPAWETPDAELLDLAVAYFRGEVTSPAASKALGTRCNSNAVSRLSAALRNAARAGLVEIKAVDK
jgi:hypothetical protein